MTENQMAENQNQNLVSAAVGMTFDDGHTQKTETVERKFDVSELSPEAMNAIVSRGLSVVLAEFKAGMPKDISRHQFRDIMNGYTIQQIGQQALMVKARGRGKSEYPQAMRQLDAKSLREYQKDMILKNQLIQLPVSLETIITNKGIGQAGADELLEAVALLESLAKSEDHIGQAAKRLEAWISQSAQIDLE